MSSHDSKYLNDAYFKNNIHVTGNILNENLSSKLSSIESNIENLNDRINIINVDPDNLLSMHNRLERLENFFSINEQKKTITIPEDSTLEILGNLRQGNYLPNIDNPPSDFIEDYKWIKEDSPSARNIEWFNKLIPYFQNNNILYDTTPNQNDLTELRTYLGQYGTITELYKGQADNTNLIYYIK